MRLTMVIVHFFTTLARFNGTEFNSFLRFLHMNILVFFFEMYFRSMSDYGLQLSLAKDLSSIIGLACTPQNEYARNLI